MDISAAQAIAPARVMWRTISDAWRGITRTEIAAALLLGVAYWLSDFLPSLGLIPHHATLAAGHIVTIITRYAGTAFSLMLAIVVADRVTGRDSRRRVAYAAAVVMSALVGPTLADVVELAVRPDYAERYPGGLLSAFSERFFLWLILGGGATFIYTDWRWAQASRARMRAAELERARTAKRALESRLLAMQARVEPQFLFNTLAQVRDLYRMDPSLGERMLDELIAYLHAAMPQMRDTTSTVEKEVQLARAYLGILGISRCNRLQAAVDVRAEIGDARFPPLLLLPLIDHAMAHGLERMGETRFIQIAASQVNERTQVVIKDSGGGFEATEGDPRIRALHERLATLYERAGTLEFRHDDQRSTHAVIQLPFERSGFTKIEMPAAHGTVAATAPP